MAGKKARTNACRKAQYSNYKATNQKDKNKAKRLIKTLANNPNDTLAKNALEKINPSIIKNAMKDNTN